MSIDAHGSWIQVHDHNRRGRILHPLNPQPGEINVYSAARALSYMCRYNGNVLTSTRLPWHKLRPGALSNNAWGNRIYSVLQHSLIISYCVPPEYALEAHLHDHTEGCGLPDVPRPVKLSMPEYKRLENDLWAAICREYNFPAVELPQQVHRWDRLICATERRDLLGTSAPGARWDIERLEALPLRILPLTPMQAYAAWVKRYEELTCAPRTDLTLHRVKNPPQPSEARRRYNRLRYACGLRYMHTGAELAGLPDFARMQELVTLSCA